MGNQRFTPAARASCGLETTMKLLSPCWCVLRVLSSGPRHRMTGKQSSIDLVVTAGRRRYADMWFPRNSNSAVRCGYWIKWMSRRVIRAIVPCTMHQSRNRLAGTSRLDATLAELLRSELETSPWESTSACTLSEAWSA